MNKKQRNRKLVTQNKRNRLINRRYTSTIKTLSKLFTTKIKNLKTSTTSSTESSTESSIPTATFFCHWFNSLQVLNSLLSFNSLLLVSSRLRHCCCWVFQYPILLNGEIFKLGVESVKIAVQSLAIIRWSVSTKYQLLLNSQSE